MNNNSQAVATIIDDLHTVLCIRPPLDLLLRKFMAFYMSRHNGQAARLLTTKCVDTAKLIGEGDNMAVCTLHL